MIETDILVLVTIQFTTRFGLTWILVRESRGLVQLSDKPYDMATAL